MPHLQLKDIPPGMHDALRHQASASGVSMREYVLRLIEADLGKVDSYDEMIARLNALARAQRGGPSAVEVLREGRETREAELLDRLSR